jgi:glucosylceramidase
LNGEETFPGKNLIFTEGCIDKFDEQKIGEWKNGEQYGRSMINDFNNGTVGWTDWNILLDERGGPNHVGNFCFAPVHANTKTGQLTYLNSFHYIEPFQSSFNQVQSELQVRQAMINFSQLRSLTRMER